MNKRTKKMLMGTVAALGLSVGLASTAHATFQIDLTPGGEKLFLNDSKGSTIFSGDVNNNSSFVINGVASTPVDVSNGFATIKPSDNHSTLLTSLTFTPASSTLYSDFSFRGQLNEAGKVTVTVQAFGEVGTQTFTFDIAKANQDFSQIGIVSLDGETIQWVQVSTDTSFKEEKQNEFSFAPVPEPGTIMAGILLLLPIGASALRTLKRK